MGGERGNEMRKELIEQLDGHDRIARQIEVTRRFGPDHEVEKGAAARYIERLHPHRLTLRVARIIKETGTAATLRLVADRGVLPPFLAGQYIAVYPEVNGILTGRPYSISSPPNQTGFYDITVRRVDGGLVSNFLLDDLSVGETIQSSGPAGHFVHNPVIHAKTMVCIAGGSGITPIMSMIREVVDRGLDRRVVLFYGNRNLDEAIFHDELEAIAGRDERIRYIPVVESPEASYSGCCGYITGKLMADELKTIGGKTFFVCGPQAMYDFCFPELDALDVPRRSVRREVYGPPARVWTDPAWPAGIGPEDRFVVHVQGGGTFQATAGEPLLNAMERANLPVPSLCRSGECSLCRIKILSGRVFQPAGVRLRASDRQFGYTHACASYPLEDLTIMR
jgi:ferredoxin-NADP reductase